MCCVLCVVVWVGGVCGGVVGLFWGLGGECGGGGVVGLRGGVGGGWGG